MQGYSSQSVTTFDISNGKQIFPLNNIFQQKFNMASPNNFINKSNHFAYTLPFNSWVMPPNNPYAFNNNMRYASFQQPFHYSYMFPQPNYYTIPQLTSFNPNSSPNAVQTTQTAPPLVVEEKTIRGINKIQKKQKKSEGVAVIQISDDEELAQQEKPCQDKSTSASNKLNPPESLINIKINEQLKKQQKESTIKQERKIKEKNQTKLYKNKQLCKINKNKKIYKSEVQNKKTEQKQAHIFSQRIIQKNDAKKQVYRLTKKERQLLQIGFLRDVANQILTGPQFQAKIPTFISSTSNLQTWKKELKANLLERLEKNQE